MSSIAMDTRSFSTEQVIDFVNDEDDLGLGSVIDEYCFEGSDMTDM